MELGRIEISKSLPDVELAIMACDSKTIHFFEVSENSSSSSAKLPLNNTGESSEQSSRGQAAVQEESKISEFFRRIKEKVLPQALTMDGSSLRIYLEQEVVKDLPYNVFLSPNSNLLVTFFFYY